MENNELLDLINLELKRKKKIKNLKIFKRIICKTSPYILCGSILLGIGKSTFNVFPFSSNTEEIYEYSETTIEENYYNTHSTFEKSDPNYNTVFGVVKYYEPWEEVNISFKRTIREFIIIKNDEINNYSIEEIRNIINENPRKVLSLLSCDDFKTYTEETNNKNVLINNNEKITVTKYKYNKNNKTIVEIDNEVVGAVYSFEALVFLLFCVSKSLIDDSKKKEINYKIKKR